MSLDSGAGAYSHGTACPSPRPQLAGLAPVRRATAVADGWGAGAGVLVTIVRPLSQPVRSGPPGRSAGRVLPERHEAVEADDARPARARDRDRVPPRPEPFDEDDPTASPGGVQRDPPNPSAVDPDVERTGSRADDRGDADRAAGERERDGPMTRR